MNEKNEMILELILKIEWLKIRSDFLHYYNYWFLYEIGLYLKKLETESMRKS